MGRLQDLDVSRLLFWLSRRQCDYGGFNGRTNKLLDSCYSFWVGAIFKIVDNYFNKKISIDGRMLYSEFELQRYVLSYCQDERGGLWDKPGKKRDLYHTCYAMCGLSLSQEVEMVNKENETSDIDPIYNVEKDVLKEAEEFFSKIEK